MPRSIFQRPRQRLRRELARRADVNDDRRVIRPLGTGGHALVELPGGHRKIVGNVSGRTFAPGSLVPTGRHQDSFGEVILGAPPPGRGGALPVIRRERHTGSPLVTLQAWGYRHDGVGIWEHVLYEPGSPWEPVEVLASLNSGDATPAQLHVIRRDTSGSVSSGSLAYALAEPPGSDIAVWDPASGTVHRYTSAAGLYATPAVYGDGYLWWAEYETTTTTGQVIQLRRAPANLSGAGDIGSGVAIPDPGPTVDWDGFELVALTGDALIVQVYWADNIGGELSGSERIRLPLSGAAGERAEAGGGPGTAAPGVRAPGGGAYIPRQLGVEHQPNSASSGPVSEWPPAWSDGNVLSVTVVDGETHAYQEDAGFPPGRELARGPDQGPYGSEPTARDAVTDPVSLPLAVVPA